MVQEQCLHAGGGGEQQRWVGHVSVLSTEADPGRARSCCETHVLRHLAAKQGTNWPTLHVPHRTHMQPRTERAGKHLCRIRRCPPHACCKAGERGKKRVYVQAANGAQWPVHTDMTTPALLRATGPSLRERMDAKRGHTRRQSRSGSRCWRTHSKEPSALPLESTKGMAE